MQQMTTRTQSLRTRSRQRQRQRRRQRRGRRSEGLVLLSVLMIIMMGTAIATVTVNDTRRALYSVRAHRVDVQGRYAAEGSLMATFGWFDDLGATPGLFETAVLSAWSAVQKAPPMVPFVPEPAIPLWQGMGPADQKAWLHNASRVVGGQVMASMDVNTEIPPHTRPGFTAGGLIDNHGIFGPNNAFGPARDFEVDLFDCVRLAGQGDAAAGGSNAVPDEPLRCQVTARQRSLVMTMDDAGDSVSCTWTVPKQGVKAENTYVHYEFQSTHTASAVIETPPVSP